MQQLIMWLFCLALGWEASCQMRTESVRFDSEEITLAGELRKPEGEGSFPAIIFLVGSGEESTYRGSYDDFCRYFLEEEAQKRGYAIFHFDKRGIGQSEGKWHTSSLEERAKDAVAAAYYLRKRSDIQHDRLYVVGHSQGGWIVQLCLATAPEVFAGGVSMAGATFGVKEQIIQDYTSSYICREDLPYSLARAKAEHEVGRFVRLARLFPIKKQWKQLQVIHDFEIAPYIQKIGRPLLYMFGEHDRLIDKEIAIKKLEGLFPDGLPTEITYNVISGVNHSFEESLFCKRVKQEDVPFSAIARAQLWEWLEQH